MKDERYKELMEQVGMPNSASLLIALQQVANEVAQEVHSMYRDKGEEIHIKYHGKSGMKHE